jgi:aryl-alcohol dehydrogenase-like predicted oxidoreductase
MKRRHFLGAAAFASASTLVARSAHGEEANGSSASGSAPTPPIPITSLGKSGLSVTRLGAGTGMRGYFRRSNQTRLGEEKFHSLLRYAYDQGIRYFDLADLYGTHPDLIPALKGVDRSEITLVSKIWWRDGGLQEQERLDADVLVDRFLGEIQTDYIDLVHLHCVTDADWPSKLAKQMDLLEELKQKGKIRAHGVSVHAIPALEVAAEHPWVDAVHTRINPYGLSMDDKPEVVVPILQKMHENGKGITGMKIVGEGKLRDDPAKKKESVEYVYGLGCVDTIIVGFEKPEEIDEIKKLALAALAKGA